MEMNEECDIDKKNKLGRPRREEKVGIFAWLGGGRLRRRLDLLHGFLLNQPVYKITERSILRIEIDAYLNNLMAIKTK